MHRKYKAKKLIEYKEAVQKELIDILNYWQRYSIDNEHGGFYGEVSDDNIPNASADKGSVLNARVLWTFSRAYNYTNDECYLSVAKRAYAYIVDYFIDQQYGGVYWTVSAKGDRANEKKQVYAQAFCIYALSEFYKATNDDEALRYAIGIFNLIEQYSFDKVRGGYYEAFSRDWKPLSDQRLSDKDQNDAKTMNTHLHIVEAYSSLYRGWKNETLKKQIRHLLDCFSQHIIDTKTNHLILFFDEEWAANSSVISFGHDIEAAWILLECAESIDDNERINLMKEYAVSLTNAALQGLDNDGGLFYEQDEKLIKEKHWWPQAEAMVGLLNAYEVSKDEKCLRQSLNVLKFIQSKIKSPTGEWLWGIDEQDNPMQGYYKAGLWKCPYHNARACIEVAERISRILNL